MATTFTAAPEVEALARDLIREHHQHLITHGVRVTFLFRDDVQKKAGQEVWGTCQKVSNLNAFLAAGEDDQEEGETPPFFVIVIARPIWDRATPAQRRALVDHELAHAYAEEDKEGAVRLTVLGHDLEEFRAVVNRHGLWREALKDFAAACEEAQLTIPLEEDEHTRLTIEAGGKTVETTVAGMKRATARLSRPAAVIRAPMGDQ